MKRAFVVVSLVAALAGCAEAPPAAVPATVPVEEPRAHTETLEVLRASMVQRFLREAPAVTRGGVARLVTMVPLDEGPRAKLATAVSGLLSAERLENEAGVRVEKELKAEEIAALGAALDQPGVRAVIDAASGADPSGDALAKFLADPRNLPADRKALVKELMDASWSPGVIDRLTRAPVAAAGRMVASAAKDDASRTDLLHIADQGPPPNPDALVVAFAFLWKDVDGAQLAAARDFFTSELGKKSTPVLVGASTAGLSAIAGAVEAAMR